MPSATPMYYSADIARGACSIETGPSSTEPNTPLAFTANVAHVWNDSLKHQISYRGPLAANIPPPIEDVPDTGPGDANSGFPPFDASIGDAN